MKLPFGDGLLFDEDDIRRRPFQWDLDRPVRGTKFVTFFISVVHVGAHVVA